MADDRPIGIFDSGVGGLTVVKEVIQALPMENIVYFGDTARVPYGSKSGETVTRFSKQIMRFLLTQDIKAIIVACNTICSVSLAALRETFDVPIIDVIQPGIDAGLSATRSGRIGVIGTEQTIRSGVYQNSFREKAPDIFVYAKPCPLFVPLVEEGWTNNTVARITVDIYLQEMADKEVDSLVLGCTHYPILRRCIQETLGGVTIVNPAETCAERMKDFLETHRMRRESASAPYRAFHASDQSSRFTRMCRLVLEEDYEAQKVDIEKY